MHGDARGRTGAEGSLGVLTTGNVQYLTLRTVARICARMQLFGPDETEESPLPCCHAEERSDEASTVLAHRAVPRSQAEIPHSAGAAFGITMAFWAI